MITFSQLKEFHETVKLEQNVKICEYFNQFSGENILEKFKNILRIWEYSVSETLPINNGEKTVNVDIEYILENIPVINESIITGDDIKIEISIPEFFEYGDDFIPIYSILKSIRYNDLEMQLGGKSLEERKEIIDKFPASFYNKILSVLMKDKSCTISFDNPALSKINLNFLTNEPLFFLRGLFDSYTEDYFRDIIYHLSSRIDGRLIQEGTIKDIEYWISKYSEENKEKT